MPFGLTIPAPCRGQRLDHALRLCSVLRVAVDGKVLPVRGSGQLAVESERGQYRLAGLDARNVKTQETLRCETTLSVGWIAQELHSGVPQTPWKARTKQKKNGAETRD